MKIINYDPARIQEEYKVLEREIHKRNQEAKRIHKKALVFISIAILLFAAMSTLLITFTCTKDINLILGIISSVFCCIATCILIINLIVGIDDSGNTRSISNEMSFEMKFWKICNGFDLLKIDVSEDNRLLINIHKEDENHFVSFDTICAKKIVNSTKVNEPVLDVSKGYIIVPYQIQQKPIFEEGEIV